MMKEIVLRNAILTIGLLGGMLLAGSVGFALGEEYPSERSMHVAQFRCCIDRDRIAAERTQCENTLEEMSESSEESE